MRSSILIKCLPPYQLSASACPLSNLSPVFRPSVKRKIEIREVITQQREKRLSISYLALKLRYINKTQTKSGVEKSYFNLVNVFLFSAKTRVYKQNTRTYSRSGAKNSLFTKPFTSFLSRGNEKLLQSQRFPRRQSGNYASSQAHRCIQISSAAKNPREHHDVLL